MTGSVIDHIAAFGADLVFGFGCRPAGGVTHYGGNVVWVAVADISMAVGAFVTPYACVKVVDTVCRNDKVDNLCTFIVKMLAAIDVYKRQTSNYRICF